METAAWIAFAVLVVAVVSFLGLYFGVDGNGEAVGMSWCIGVFALATSALCVIGVLAWAGDGVAAGNEIMLETIIEWITGQPVPEATP